MADAVVAFLLQNLSQLLAHEAKLLCGVEDRIRSLHNELEMIIVFLKASEGKKSKNEMEQKVVSQIRDIAQVAEDVIDTFVTNVTIHKRRSMLGKMLHGVDHAKVLHDINDKIDKVKTTLNEIRENKAKYDFPESDHSMAREQEERVLSLHKRRRNVEEEDVVGFVHDSKVVINRLIEGDSRGKVVSIIGMGGLGKTTLARKVYNSNEVKRYFNCRAWVYVSNECRAKELLLGLVKHLMPNPEYGCKSNEKGKTHKEANVPLDFSILSEDELKKKVQECLKRKRYLLVLDDLWKKQDWDEVQDAFPDDNRGSKILITSRLKEVALHTSQDPPYCLQFLSEEQSWELFSRKVFRGEEYPSDLEPLGKQIVESCRGLPLSIVVLAGLLANKERSHREWSKVVGHVKWYLTRDETQVKDIVLKLSYDNLPRRLKPCFLYLGIFPEDYEIHVRQLLERWVAEGFIQESGSRDPDDVAEDYLYELIDRSLIQVARVKTSGGVKTCRIHDLLRDLCISEGKEDKVFEVCTDNNILIPTKPRRLSIHCSMPSYISSNSNDHSCVRSLFCFDPHYYVAPSEWKWLSKGFKLVRVLDLVGTCCIKIPSNLAGLIHLRYLRIDSQFVRRIPTSICTLQNLQTLDLGPCIRIISISFPSGIWKLKHLRHLYTHGPIMLRNHRSELDGEVMWNLQTISSIAFNRHTTSLIQKGRFPKLRNLGLHISSNCEGELPKLLLSLQQLGHLNNSEDLPTCAASFPPNITKLTLTGISCLNENWMNALGNLTKLRQLSLSGGSADPFEFNFVAGGFPQLQVFKMRFLKVQKWKLANGAMPLLQKLVIDRCRGVVNFLNELGSLTTLIKVQVWESSKTTARMLRYLETKNGIELVVGYLS
ncbi:Virus X resistance protein-like, coiled-coil domain [Sesbania bispinosa]|nr:Virus X resistance protein-like, coiled-coil domain [Sesbania bispinosa]